MRIISAEEMAAIDTNCRYFGLLPLQLMENAGAALACEVAARARGERIAIVAGRGNNGSDSFVAARHLAELRLRYISWSVPRISPLRRLWATGVNGKGISS
jgi:NAD(P)H-hydrate epimerase